LQAELAGDPRRGGLPGSGRRTTLDRRVLHRTNALKKPQWTLVPKNEMRPSPRRPSAGATPRAPWILEQSSLSTTTAAAGTSSPNQPPIFHKPSSHLRTSEAESRRPRHPAKATSHCRRTPVQRLHVGRPTSTGSPSVPEWSTNGARKNPRGLIPRRRRRLVDVDWKPRPRTPRTKPRPYPASQQETSGLRHLATARRPSEAEETAVPGGGGRIAFFPLLQL